MAAEIQEQQALALIVTFLFFFNASLAMIDCIAALAFLYKKICIMRCIAGNSKIPVQ